MVKIRKAVSLFVCCALSMTFLLAGCKTQGSGKASSESGKASSEDLKPYNLVWYMRTTSAKGDARVTAKISDYLKKKINATITINNLGSDYATKIPVIISSGEKFDVCFTASWVADYHQNAIKGNFVNLTKTGLLDKYGKDLKKEIDPALLTSSSINGDIYAVPVNKEAAYAWAWTFNKAYLDKYNLDISNIKTLADAEPLFKIIHEKEPDIPTIVADKGFAMYNYLPYDPINGSASTLPGVIPLDGKSTKIVDQYELPEYQEYFATMHKFYQEGYIAKDAATNTADPNIEKSGKYFARQISWTPDAVGTPDVYGVTREAALIQKPAIFSSAGTGAMQAISNSSDDKERAMMFLNLLWSDKTLVNLVDYGEEGTDYVKVDDNTIDYPSGVTGKTSEYSNVSAWCVGNQRLSYVRKGIPADHWTKVADFNKQAVKSPALGFSFDNTNVKTQIAAMQNVLNQYLPSLAVGAVDPTTYLPQMVQKLKDNGMSDLLKEEQAQYDKWRTSKK